MPPAPKPQKLDTDTDRYRSFYDALRAIIDQGEAPDRPIERLEATMLANGEVTYRWWEARAEEPDGGILPPVN